MSEIKGQLLGIILVLAVFGVVIGALTAAFQHSAETIQTRVEEAATLNQSEEDDGPVVDPNARAHRGYTLSY